MKSATEIGEVVKGKSVPDLVVTYQVTVSKAETDFMTLWMKNLNQPHPVINEIPTGTSS
jgi:hypothetical protein